MAKVSLRAYNREIEGMIDSGHLDEAIANCRHILKIFPKHLDTYRLLGKAYLEYKRYPEAVDIFSRVLVAVPNDFVAHVGMSIIRDEENKLDDAIWHMERAFETQPSNAAIQSELQRLYGRRDGVRPPRIRMTRGALAHMYVQGELYPQAISEIKSVLKEDSGRADMQALLARACYRSGLKNEAADAASSVLRTYPYCLDANRVLMEILGSDRAESAHIYRQHVIELDPYAALVTGTVFQSGEVPDAAVSLERLDWNGQPVSLQPDWAKTQAIGLEEVGTREEQPDWLRSMFEEPLTQPPPQTLGSAQDQSREVPAFDSYAPGPGPESKEDLPDFLRSAGWAKSTGAFDESKSASAYEEPETQPPIEKGELPDWVKAMAPVETEQPDTEPDEELPDWINKIGTGVAPISSDSGEGPDWITRLEQPKSQASEDQPDWLKGLGQSEQPASAASADQPDWLMGFGSETESAPAASTEGQPAPPIQPEAQSLDEPPDWMKQTVEPELAVPSTADEELDWLKGFGAESESTPAAPPSDELDWLAQLGEKPKPVSSEPMAESDFLVRSEEQPGPAEPASLSGALDFRDESGKEPEQAVPSASEPTTTDFEKLGTSEQERDDSFAWLEGLAARQGASEGLLTKPEERMEDEPDWVKRAKGLGPEQAAAQPSGDLEELGKSEQERDDSFAWLESLAARQGASEGLLTKPEERSEQEPDWIRQARDLGEAPEGPALSPPPVSAEAQPSPADDTTAWLRSLDQEEPASLSSHENDATGIWLKSLDEQTTKAPPAEQAESELPAWMQNIGAEEAIGSSAPAMPEEESAEKPGWMGLTEEAVEVQPAQPAAEEPEQEMPAWMQNIEEEQPTQVNILPMTEMEAERSAQFDDIPEWMQFIEDKETAEESMPAVPAADAVAGMREEEAAAEASEWMGAIEEPVASTLDVTTAGPASEPEEIPAWLSSLEEEETQVTTPAGADEDLPAWLRGEEEPAPEPSELEPTQAADWQPMQEQQVEVPPPAPEPVPEPALEQEPVAPVEVAISEMPVDPILGRARDDFSRGDISGALDTYGRLIRKTRLLDEVIHDLREALYRYPVDVGIWQSLGDAYMRANRLQDALDAYTKAEELLR